MHGLFSVDPKYHAFIRDPEVNVTAELIQLESVAQAVEAKVQNLPEKPINVGDGDEKNKALVAGARIYFSIYFSIF
jgi:hypothetical protein